MTVASTSDATTAERPDAGAAARSLETAARATPPAPPRWAATYVNHLVYTDAIAIVIAVAVAQLVRFGNTDAVLHSASSELSYTAVSVLLAVGWPSVAATSSPVPSPFSPHPSRALAWKATKASSTSTTRPMPGCGGISTTILSLSMSPNSSSFRRRRTEPVAVSHLCQCSA